MRGSTEAFIHKRYPTTNQRGSFCLLCFQPVPIHSSLSNLFGDDYSKPSILTSALVRTLDRHARQQRRTPRTHPCNPSSSARSNAYRNTPRSPAVRRSSFSSIVRCASIAYRVSSASSSVYRNLTSELHRFS